MTPNAAGERCPVLGDSGSRISEPSGQFLTQTGSRGDRAPFFWGRLNGVVRLTRKPSDVRERLGRELNVLKISGQERIARARLGSSPTGRLGQQTGAVATDLLNWAVGNAVARAEHSIRTPVLGPGRLIRLTFRLILCFLPEMVGFVPRRSGET